MCHPFGAAALETAGPSKTNVTHNKGQFLGLVGHKGDDTGKGGMNKSRQCQLTVCAILGASNLCLVATACMVLIV